MAKKYIDEDENRTYGKLVSAGKNAVSKYLTGTVPANTEGADNQNDMSDDTGNGRESWDDYVKRMASMATDEEYDNGDIVEQMANYNVDIDPYISNEGVLDKSSLPSLDDIRNTITDAKYIPSASVPSATAPTSSKFQQMLDQYLAGDEFKFDLNGEELYQQYKDQFTRNGQMAMMDTIGQASALTGGYGSTYAQNAGQQAYQGYMNQLNEVVPDVYDRAYQRWMNKRNGDLQNIELQYGLEQDAKQEQANLMTNKFKEISAAQNAGYDYDFEKGAYYKMPTETQGQSVKDLFAEIAAGQKIGLDYDWETGEYFKMGDEMSLTDKAKEIKAMQDIGMIYNPTTGSYDLSPNSEYIPDENGVMVRNPNIVDFGTRRTEDDLSDAVAASMDEVLRENPNFYNLPDATKKALIIKNLEAQGAKYTQAEMGVVLDYINYILE